MPIEYSHGFHATVFIDESDSTTVTRTEKQADSRQYERLFIRHQIASTLFPDNFIKVQSVRRHLITPPTPIHATRYQTTLTSRLADVPPEHAIFSAHYADTTKPQLDRYQSMHHLNFCSCAICLDHFRFHADNHLLQRAEQVSDQCKPYGIQPPIDDPTDYCLTKSGIIFFEIESFNFGIFIRSLQQRQESLHDRYLLWMGLKYQKSFYLSQTQSPNGALALN